jgi:hypothetical protein
VVKRLILTCGLPRSGKSTWARGQGVPVVNPDSVRLALHGQVYRKESENMVWAIAETMIRALFIARLGDAHQVVRHAQGHLPGPGGGVAARRPDPGHRPDGQELRESQRVALPVRGEFMLDKTVRPLNIEEASLVTHLRKNIAELIERCDHGMGMRPRKVLGHVSGRAKWLKRALEHLENGYMPDRDEDGVEIPGPPKK